uniref:Muscular LMNA-interacting protein n=1 Tax=Takifugu rubripes TaxID=31033 RepID=A0A3B5KAZ2_TAKRU
MDNMNRSVGKLSGGVPFTFTFVPVLRKLPSEIPVTVAEGSGPPAAKQSLTASREKASGQTMSAGDIFKVETVFISDPVEGGAGNVLLPKITNQLQPLPDHVSPPESRPRPPVGAQAENTAGLVAAGTTSMETAVGKHGRAPQRWCRDAAGLSETHKIKLNYKSLAAIPTNTLLLDQQVIDEQVERGDSGVDKGVPDTHAEMCSPAQFRQQSAELYAVIDEVLADSIPPTPQHSRTPTPTPGLQAKQNNSSSPKSLGRETKYASLCSLPPSNTADRNQLGSKKMKPGIIRPMTAIPRLRVEDEEGYERDAFDIRGSSLDSRKVEVEKDFYALSRHGGSRDMWKPERRSPSTAWDLQITEAEDGPPVKGEL